MRFESTHTKPRVIIFGIGKYYKKNQDFLFENFSIVAYTDNSYVYGKTFENQKLISPEDICTYDYDKIIICSVKYQAEIYKQLVNFGIESSRIECLFTLLLIQKRGQISYYLNRNEIDDHKKKILIITTDMNYNGGTMAAVFMVMALTELNYYVLIAAPVIDEKMKEELSIRGISFVVAPALTAPGEKELAIADDFDLVIVNVYQNIAAACEFSKRKPVLWWIHETKTAIEQVNALFFKYADRAIIDKIPKFAVCRRVKENIIKTWGNINVGILPYGLPDFYRVSGQEKKDKIVYALVGYISEIKAQDIFVKAAKLYNKDCKMAAEFWMIGDYNPKSEFFKKVSELIDGNPNIKFLGNLTREKMNEIYPQIDVIVCASRIEGIPIAVNEGLMNKKIVITVDTAGDNDYIIDGVNGFKCPGENPSALSKKMIFAAEHYYELDNLKENARKSYLELFSMDVFENNLMKVIKKITKYGNQNKCALLSQNDKL